MTNNTKKEIKRIRVRGWSEDPPLNHRIEFDKPISFQKNDRLAWQVKEGELIIYKVKKHWFND